MAFDGKSLTDYIDVATRIAEFREKHPEGSLQPVDPTAPFKVLEIGGQTFIAYTAAAYRTPDDTRPGIGVAYETFPGRTPYTKGSELQNAETSAWGRAIVAALAGDTRKGVASQEEVRNRQAERDLPPEDPFTRQARPRPNGQSGQPQGQPSASPTGDGSVNWDWLTQFEERVRAEGDSESLQAMKRELIEKLKAREIQTTQSTEMTRLVNERMSELETAA